MKKQTWWVAAIVALAISLTSGFDPARAQIAEPEVISAPLQDRWRGPFEQFLRELGMADQAAMVEKTSAFQIGGVWQPDSILFRIEDPAVCSADLCFAVIGRVIDNKFVADAMFTAGKRFTRGNTFLPLFGFHTWPAWLVGDKVTVTILETPKGWVIASNLSSP